VNSSPSATSQNSPTPFPSNAFNPLLTILTLLALPVIVFVIGAAATLYAVGHGETTFLNAPRWANGLPGVQIQGVVEAAIVAFLLLVLPEIAKVPRRSVMPQRTLPVCRLFLRGAPPWLQCFVVRGISE